MADKELRVSRNHNGDFIYSDGVKGCVVAEHGSMAWKVIEQQAKRIEELTALNHEIRLDRNGLVTELATVKEYLQVAEAELDTSDSALQRIAKQADAAANGTQSPKYHDAIECAYALDVLAEQKEKQG